MSASPLAENIIVAFYLLGQHYARYITNSCWVSTITEDRPQWIFIVCTLTWNTDFNRAPSLPPFVSISLSAWQVLCLMLFLVNIFVACLVASASTRCVYLMRASLCLWNGRIEYSLSALLLLLTIWLAHSCCLCAVHDNELRIHSEAQQYRALPTLVTSRGFGWEDLPAQPTEAHIKCCHHIVISKVTLARVPLIRLSLHLTSASPASRLKVSKMEKLANDVITIPETLLLPLRCWSSRGLINQQSVARVCVWPTARAPKSA